jgi:hypothetical protein
MIRRMTLLVRENSYARTVTTNPGVQPEFSDAVRLE